MMGHGSSGRCNIVVSIAGLLVVLLWVLPALAQDAPMLVIPPEAEAAYQVERERPAAAERMNTAVFTEISPFTAPDRAVRLPEDQQDVADD